MSTIRLHDMHIREMQGVEGKVQCRIRDIEFIIEEREYSIRMFTSLNYYL